MKLYICLLVVALAGAAFADDDCCSTEDKKEISFSWHKIWHTSYTDRKVRIMKAVFEEVMAKDKEANALVEAKGLGDHNSPAFRAYLIRTAHQFDVVINLLEDPAVLEEYLGDLATKFGKNDKLKKHFFAEVADAMEHVFPQISTCFNVGAWNRCMHRLTNILAAKVAQD